jgi:UDP-N-acetyl-alpha-D-muramoyl-L-alanyl-L-glutamate epimerase
MVEHSIHNAAVVGPIPTPGTSSMKFIFKGHDSNPEKGEIFFHFGLRGEKNVDFTEKISFPPIENNIPEVVVKSLLDNLMLILGISYWKLYCPKEIIIESNFLNKEQAEFWNTVYTKGLGEFFYKNKIDFRDLLRFPFNENAKATSINFPRQDRILLGIGGGKDSIVVSEMLKAQKKDFDILTGEEKIKQEVSIALGKNPIVFKRELDPKLFELNKEKEAYNGHIPVSAVYAFFGIMACIFYDYKTFMVGNEKSANYGNVEYLGEIVNHQWSKSEEFEKIFNEYLKKFITPSIEYFSPLRQMTELQVVEEFVKYPQYFNIFSSCNKNFKILKQVQNDKSRRWCGECPKCLFVFICLAAFLPKIEVLNIFGKNLLEEKNLIPLFEELIGKKNFKPFECVGTQEEVKEAISKIFEKGEFNETILMKHYKFL